MIPTFTSITSTSATTAIRGLAQSSVPVAVTRWGASAVPVGASSGQGSLVMTWSVSQGIAYQYFDVINVGMSDLSGQSFFVSSTYEKSGNAKPPTVTFEACVSGVWSPTTNSCSGQVITMGSTTTEFFSSLTTPLPIGQRLSARARTSPGGSSSYTTIINVLINRTQIQQSTTRNL